MNTFKIRILNEEHARAVYAKLEEKFGLTYLLDWQTGSSAFEKGYWFYVRGGKLDGWDSNENAMSASDIEATVTLDDLYTIEIDYSSHVITSLRCKQYTVSIEDGVAGHPDVGGINFEDLDNILHPKCSLTIKVSNNDRHSIELIRTYKIGCETFSHKELQGLFNTMQKSL